MSQQKAVTQAVAASPIRESGKISRAPEYMSELITYGVHRLPRGYVYQLLINLAQAQGHSDPRILADRWMQGYDTRQALNARD